MSFLVLVTIIVNTGQTSLSFKKYLENETSDSLVTKSDQTANNVLRVFESFKNQIMSTMQNILRLPPQDRDANMQNIVDNSQNNLISYQILRISKSNDKAISENFIAKKDKQDIKFEDKDPTKIIEKIKVHNTEWISSVLKNGKKNQNQILLKNLTNIQEINLPIMSIAVTFPLVNDGDIIVGVITAWQTEIIKSLGQSKLEKGIILDQNGNIFASQILNEMKTKSNYKSLSIFETASASSIRNGFKNNYVGIDGKNYFGSFTIIPELNNLIVIYEKDSKISEKQIIYTMVKSIAWSLFLVVLALGLAYYSSEGVTKNLRVLTNVTQQIANGQFLQKVNLNSQDEVEVLGQSINQMSYKIQMLLASTAEKARLEQELETAKVVQTTFFPKKDIHLENLKVTGFYTPASECGGDLWGHFEISDGIQLVYIADAMGHGAPAALVTAMAYSTCMTISDLMKSKEFETKSPASILARMNRVINEAVSGTISMTCFIAIIDFNKGKISYANAGHNFPIIIPSSPKDKRGQKTPKSLQKISSIKPVSLSLKGVPLGIDKNAQYEEKEVELIAGDKLFLFTDGLIECESPDGKVWSRKKLIEKILTYANLDYLNLKNKIINDAGKFFATQPLKDDITIVVAEIDKNWSISKQNGENIVESSFNTKEVTLNLDISDLDDSIAS